ncbi:hypothetical protein [Parvibaculum sp.]|nr:hypothetical protein [Parvibaculum sp.]MDP1627173.1 hypothetical protein [Parvibaculum sp.]MDP2148879.1 hypothetical protein [Parvibaculum sp.]MDP3329884.1 hypothetical protein [Parvibaculum sp.]
MSERMRKWLTVFAVVLTVGALIALSQRGERVNEARTPAESNHVVLAPR